MKTMIRNVLDRAKRRLKRFVENHLVADDPSEPKTALEAVELAERERRIKQADEGNRT